MAEEDDIDAPTQFLIWEKQKRVLLLYREVQRIFPQHESTLRRWVHEGKLKAHQPGKAMMYTFQSVKSLYFKSEVKE